MNCRNCGSYIDDNTLCCKSCGTVNELPTYSVVATTDSTDLDAIQKIMEVTSLSPSEIKEKLAARPATIKNKLSFTEAIALKAELDARGIKSGILSDSLQDDTVESNNYSEEFDDIEEDYDGDIDYKYEPSTNIIKRIWTVIEVAVGIFLLYLVITGKFTTFFRDIFSNANEDDISYVSMVQDMCPYQNGRSYKTAFSEEFDYNNWSYFKSGDKRIVQIKSGYNDISDELITQFLIQPTGEKNQFQVTPYAMNLSGQNLSQLEMQAVLAAIFDGETVEALAEMFFYSSLFE